LAPPRNLKEERRGKTSAFREGAERKSRAGLGTSGGTLGTWREEGRDSRKRERLGHAYPSFKGGFE